MGYSPKVIRLLSNCYSFHFFHHEDLEIIWINLWVQGHGFLQLCQWYVDFNPILDTPWNFLVWMKLPHLPLEYWTWEAFSVIGNIVGCFSYMDPHILGSHDKRMGWVLVEVKFDGGVPKDIILEWNSWRVS